MDLRPYIKSSTQLARLKRLVASTDFMYQPFIISDELEVGGGYEFIFNKIGAGFVYWGGDGPPATAPVRSRLIAPEILSDFRMANAALRRVYDDCIDAVCAQIDDISSATVCDFGCFNGYLPVSFAQRGAARAVGYDIDDRGECIATLNSILGTNAEFVHTGYDLGTGTVPKAEQFDVVCCMSVLQHILEPLRFINMLGAITKRCLFLMTSASTDEDLLMRFGEPNTIMSDYSFPWCFDNGMYLSERLLRTALKLAGFHTLIDVPINLPSEVQKRVEDVNRTTDSSAIAPHETRARIGGTLRGFNVLALRDGPSVRAADLPVVHRLGYRRTLLKRERFMLRAMNLWRKRS
jgi:hypothetical protein